MGIEYPATKTNRDLFGSDPEGRHVRRTQAITKIIPTIISRANPPGFSANAVEPYQSTRRHVLGRLTTAGLVTPRGLSWGRAAARRGRSISPAASPRPRSSTQEGRRRYLRAIKRTHRHAELQRGGHQSRPRPGRGHSLKPAAKALIRQIWEITTLPSGTWSTATSTATMPWATKPTPRSSPPV